MNVVLCEDTSVIRERMELLCIMYGIRKMLLLEKFSVWYCVPFTVPSACG